MRGLTLPIAAASLSLSFAFSAWPQGANQPAASGTEAPTAGAASPQASSTTGSDSVAAKVGDSEIRASDVAEAATGLPEQLQSMPPQMLYPMLLDQLIDRRALVIEAEKEGLQTNPEVERQITRARDTALQNALLSKEIAPTLTEEKIKEVYQKDYADKPGPEEVNAAHILVATKEQAEEIIKKLDQGADFTALARENSTDPSAKGNGGDLGFFTKADMLPAFSDAAFALKPGEITQTPVQTRFGFHVIKLIARKQAPAPTLEEAQDKIRQSLIKEGVAKALAQAKAGLQIVKYNQDGSPMTDAPGTTMAPK